MTRNRFAIFFSLLVNSAALSIGWALTPAYARGFGPESLSYVNAWADLAKAPGWSAGIFLKLIDSTSASFAGWVLVIFVNLFFYLAVGAILHRWWTDWRLRKIRAVMAGPADSPGLEPSVRPVSSRRHVLRAGASLALASVGSYAFFVDPFRLGVTQRRIAIRNLPPELAGLRIVQLTDIHHGPWFALHHVRHLVERANALSPDLVLLTGDYVHRSRNFIPPVAEALSHLRARIGIVGVMGNHDWREDAALTRAQFAHYNLPLVDNSRLILTPEGRLAASAKQGLCIAGVGDLWEDTQDYAAALADLPADMPRILLSHNPDVAEGSELAESGFRVDLMLSGHTHGGQIWLPGLGTPGIPSKYGQKYARGLVQGPVCPVFISAGIGMAVLPLRFGVLPEIAVLELARV